MSARADAAAGAPEAGGADPAGYAKAMLNILADLNEEKALMRNTQLAMLNILDDAANEKHGTQSVQTAMLNVLDDFYQEKDQLRATQKAFLNILEDVDSEKNKGDRANAELVREIIQRKRAEAELARHREHLEELVAVRTAELTQSNEHLTAANKELESFSYSVSHDLRTPLRAVDGFSRILVEEYAEKLDAEGRRIGGIVRDNAQRMGKLIDDILSFSRIGRIELVHAPIDMGRLVRSVLQDLEPVVGNRRLAFNVGALPSAEGDADMIRRVWANLLDNAVKFTASRDSATVEIEGRIDGGEAVYSVKDDGVGFDMRYVGKLFAVFQRLHSMDEFPGTGIGLAIVRRIVERHGGRAWAEGALNKGAAFHFALPVQERGNGKPR